MQSNFNDYGGAIKAAVTIDPHKKELTMLSLFSGIGGIDIAAENEGIKTIAFCEIEKYCQKVLHQRWPNVPIISDIHNINKEFLTNANIPKPDIIAGDFPANHSQPQIQPEEDLKMNEISSPKCLESQKSFNPLGLLEKMLLDSKMWGSTHCSLKWKESATPQKRSLYQLAVSRHRTEDIVSSSWAGTPMASHGTMMCQGKFSGLHLIPELGMGDCWLNPEYQEWLMGFPPEWTSLPSPVLKRWVTQ